LRSRGVFSPFFAFQACAFHGGAAKAAEQGGAADPDQCAMVEEVAALVRYSAQRMNVANDIVVPM